MFPINNLTLIKINGDPPVRWAEFEVDNLGDPETVADVRAALEDRTSPSRFTLSMVADICGADIEKATADLERMLEKQAKK